MHTGFRSSSWSILLRGALAVAFGVLVLASPSMGVRALIVMFAIFAAADGIASLSTAATHGRAGLAWGWWLVEGLIGLAIAAFAFMRPGATLLAIVLVIGFRAVVLGLFELGGALAGPRLEHRWLLGLAGVVSIAFGVLLILQPLAGTMALLWLVGAYGIVVGLALVALGLRALGGGAEDHRNNNMQHGALAH